MTLTLVTLAHIVGIQQRATGGAGSANIQTTLSGVNVQVAGNLGGCGGSGSDGCSGGGGGSGSGGGGGGGG